MSILSINDQTPHLNIGAGFSREEERRIRGLLMFEDLHESIFTQFRRNLAKIL